MCFEEVRHEQRNWDILKHLQATPFLAWLCELTDLIVFVHPYNCIYLVSNWHYWARDVDFDWGMCTHNHFVLARWPNLSFFDSTHASRWVVRWRPDWGGRAECCRVLSAPTPPTLGYYINLFIGDHWEATAVWHVPALEFVIMAFIRFLFVAEREAVGYGCHDPCTGNGDCYMITRLLRGV